MLAPGEECAHPVPNCSTFVRLSWSNWLAHESSSCLYRCWSNEAFQLHAPPTLILPWLLPFSGYRRAVVLWAEDIGFDGGRRGQSMRCDESCLREEQQSPSTRSALRSWRRRLHWPSSTMFRNRRWRYSVILLQRSNRLSSLKIIYISRKGRSWTHILTGSRCETSSRPRRREEG